MCNICGDIKKMKLINSSGPQPYILELIIINRKVIKRDAQNTLVMPMSMLSPIH